MNVLIGYIKSKTFWLNVLGVAVQVINSNTGQWFPVETGIVIQGFLNLIVRALTTKPLERK